MHIGLVVDMSDMGESSIVVLSKSEITEAPFEVVSDSGQTLPQTSDSQQPSSLSMTWYQSTSATTSLGGPGPTGNQVRPQRPLQEIVSSMQGNYNFLQDSEIDGEYYSACSVFFYYYSVLNIMA